MTSVNKTDSQDEKCGYWLMEDKELSNHNFTQAQCKEIMHVTEKELEGNQF